MNTILYAHTASANYVRCHKILNVLGNEKRKVVFFGAHRSSASAENKLSFTNNVNLFYFDKIFPHGWKSFICLIQYILKLRKLIKKLEPDVIILTNEELVLSLFLLNIRGKVILDAIDAIDIRWTRNSLLVKISSIITNYARNRADVIFEVEEFRRLQRSRYIEKTVVVRNTPPANLISNSQKSNFPLNLPDKFIYASGSLNSGINGIEILIAAVNSLPETINVKIIIAGYIPNKDLLKKINESKNFIYLGPVSFEQSLYLSEKSLGIFAFYKPINKNFVLAAPNKVYEAFALGKPLIINREIEISKFCKDEGFGFVIGYDDFNALAKLIFRLFCEEKIIPKEKTALLKMKFKENYSWEQQSKKIISFIS